MPTEPAVAAEEARRRLNLWLRYGNPRPNPVSDEGRQFENDLQLITEPPPPSEADAGLIKEAWRKRLNYTESPPPEDWGKELLDNSEITLGAMTGCIIIQPNDYDRALEIHKWLLALAGASQ